MLANFHVKVAEIYVKNLQQAFLHSDRRSAGIQQEIKIPQELRSCRYYYTLLRRPCSQRGCRVKTGSKVQRGDSRRGTSWLLMLFHWILIGIYTSCWTTCLKGAHETREPRVSWLLMWKLSNIVKDAVLQVSPQVPTYSHPQLVKIQERKVALTCRQLHT